MEAGTDGRGDGRGYALSACTCVECLIINTDQDGLCVRSLVHLFVMFCDALCIVVWCRAPGEGSCG